MRRSTRLTASLIRSLLLGSVMVPATVGASAFLVSCQDENQPEYWIEKLDDKAWRPRAITRLAQFYEDAMTRADKDVNKPEVQELLNKLAEPLTKMYVEEYDQLDEKTRESLINLLASFRDPRVEPALKQAFAEFGKRGRGGRDVKWASRAVRDMKPKGLSGDVFAAFMKTKPSTKEGAYYRDLNEALVAVVDPSWTADLKAVLGQEFPVHQKPTADQQKDITDLTYHTITAAQLLGEIGDPSAVPELLKVVLDPTKAGAANDALLALTKIGKPSVDAAVKLLNDKDPALADFHKKRVQKATGADKPPEGKPHVPIGAIVLGTIGRKEGIKPLLEALAAEKDDATKAQLLGAIAMLPHTAEVQSAFISGLSSLSKDSAEALQSLAEPAAGFFDPSVVSTLLSRADDLKDNKIARSLFALAATKAMGPGEVAAVGKLVDSLPKEDGALGTHMEKVKNGYEMAKKVMTACKKDAACYLNEAKKSANQGDKTQMAGIKAIYMFGQLKGPEGGKDLIGAMEDFEKSELRYAAAQVIDHHSPNGNAALADALEKIIDKNKDSVDRDKVAGDKPLRDVMYRLRARAQ